MATDATRNIPKAGEKFGRLTIVEVSSDRPRVYMVCLCNCGNHRTVRRDHLRSGRTSSCGCWHDEAAVLVNTKHGHTPRSGPTVEYRAWCNMIDRCYRISNKRYVNYGGRGITVSPGWRHDFSAFFAHVGRRPAAKMSIDRIDVNGNYEPGNVRWATPAMQARNVRNIKRIHAFGKALTLAEWADETGMDRRKIFNRMRTLGWSAERAVSP